MKKYLGLILMGVIVSVNVNSQETLTDSRDGEVYKVVKVGSTSWLGENLRFETKEGSESWRDKTGHNPDPYSLDGPPNKEHDKTHGRYYSYEAALKSCPTGWTLPEESDFVELSNKYGGDSKSGHHLKSTSDWNWLTNGDNSSGFNAKPYGKLYNRNNSGKGNGANFWVTGKVVDGKAPFRFFSSEDGNTDKAFKFQHETFTVSKVKMSVRCIKK